MSKSGSKVVYKLRSYEIDRNAKVMSVMEDHDVFLRRFMRMRFISTQEQQDILQEVYVRLLKLEKLEEILLAGIGPIRGYLMKVIVNHVTDIKRKAIVRQEYFHDSYDDEIVHGGQLSPECSLSVKQELEQVKEILKKQKPKYRKAFLLSRVHNKSYREIADEMNVSVSMVEKYISKVLREIKRKLDKK